MDFRLIGSSLVAPVDVPDDGRIGVRTVQSHPRQVVLQPRVQHVRVGGHVVCFVGCRLIENRLAIAQTYVRVDGIYKLSLSQRICDQ